MRTPSAREFTCLMLTALALVSRGHAQATTKYPVVSKVEIIFSLVTHYAHIQERIAFYNDKGSPKGNTNYAVPHLVYEPIVTLYNPYNEPLTMTRSRVKIWDPPVGFAFKKNDAYLRSDFASGNFHSLGRFQINTQFDTNARKTLTLFLTELKSNGYPGGPITLQPGESKVFSAWVESNWSWAKETAGGYTPRSFFDWNADSNFTNRDNRTANPFGVEAVPSELPFITSTQAGFQTDGLSYSSGQRPTATLYDFENPSQQGYNFVAIKLTDTITVETKSMRTSGLGSNNADFQVDLLKGLVQDSGGSSSADTVKTFPMTLSGIIQNDAAPVITRTFRAGNLLQPPNDMSPGGKTTFASLVMLAKTSALRKNSFYKTLGITRPDQPVTDLYEMHFKETMDFNLTTVIASDAPLDDAPQIIGVNRIGNILYVDFTGRPAITGGITWKVRGTSSLADGFPDDLGSISTVQTGQSANGIYKAAIDISGRGERYFVRIEE